MDIDNLNEEMDINNAVRLAEDETLVKQTREEVADYLDNEAEIFDRTAEALRGIARSYRP